jgi:hypothetical protein
MAGIILTNLADYTFGIPNDIAGINVQKLSAKATSKMVEVPDRQGRIIGRVDLTLKVEYTLEGFINSATGLQVSPPGTIVAVAGLIAVGGVTAGAIFLEDPTVDYASGELAKFNCKLTQYADIPADAVQVVI